MSKKIVIGLVGEKGAGKGTFTDILKKIAPQVSIARIKSSEILLETLIVWRLPHSRENFIKLATTMVQGFHPAVLTDAVYERIIDNEHEIMIFDGVRWDTDVEMVHKFPVNYIVYVTAPEKVRYERTKLRKEKKGEGDVTFEQFLEEEQAATEQDIKRIGKKADSTINNGGTLEDFENQVQEFYNKFLKTNS